MLDILGKGSLSGAEHFGPCEVSWKQGHRHGPIMNVSRGKVHVFGLHSGSGHTVSRRSVRRAAFRRLVDWQIECGSSALVPCGTTGENSTLSNAEHHRVIEVCIEQAAGRVPVIAGCGSNDTMNALLHMNFSKKCGAPPRWSSRPITTGPARKACSRISATWLKTRAADRALQRAGSHRDRSPARDGVRTGRRYPDRIIGIKDASGDLSRVTDHRMGIKGFASCAAMTNWRCRSTRRAASAASR
jgi:dihydrodipicolinate synthase/N-acetylneuraminate lyase